MDNVRPRHWLALSAALSLLACIPNGQERILSAPDCSTSGSRQICQQSPRKETRDVGVSHGLLETKKVDSNNSPTSVKAGVVSHPKVGPPYVVGFLKDNPDLRLTFIVSTVPGELDKVVDRVGESALWTIRNSTAASRLRLIEAFAATIPVSAALSLSTDPSVLQVWYVHEDLITTYVGIIHGLESALRYKKTGSYGYVVANISLSPPAQLMPLKMESDEPMHKATKIAADEGVLPVFAFGNYSDSTDSTNGIVNPWCLPEWVTCVGAVSGDATTLWKHSARGAPEDPATWPDVVAWGIDVITRDGTMMIPRVTSAQSPSVATKGALAYLDSFVSEHPSLGKTRQRKEYDEQHPLFKARIPRSEWDHYTLETGTSMAAPQAARALAQICFYIKEHEKHLPTMKATVLGKDGPQTVDLMIDEPSFSIVLEKDRITNVTRPGIKRLVGELISQDDGSLQIRYPRGPLWKVAKQVLMDTATPIGNYGPHEVGAGFVSPDYAEQWFGKYGVERSELWQMHVTE